VLFFVGAGGILVGKVCGVEKKSLSLSFKPSPKCLSCCVGGSLSFFCISLLKERERERGNRVEKEERDIIIITKTRDFDEEEEEDKEEEEEIRVVVVVSR
jgi:hypothetical protein